jgi:hypothetical protein
MFHIVAILYSTVTGFATVTLLLTDQRYDYCFEQGALKLKEVK